MINKESGQVSRLLLVLAVIVLVAVVITFLVLRMATKPPAPTPPVGGPTPVAQPVYTQTIGNIAFVFKFAVDRGNILKVSDITNTQYQSSYEKDLVATAGGRFIQVTVGAQNMGKVNIEQGAWDIGNIIDSQGREFVPLDSYTINPWLPNSNFCGGLLKPAFDPAPCTKIYEVSNESTGLKIQIETGKNNTAQNFSSGNISSSLIDLIVNKS